MGQPLNFFIAVGIAEEAAANAVLAQRPDVAQIVVGICQNSGSSTLTGDFRADLTRAHVGHFVIFSQNAIGKVNIDQPVADAVVNKLGDLVLGKSHLSCPL